jgi:hypothetical protein
MNNGIRQNSAGDSAIKTRRVRQRRIRAGGCAQAALFVVMSTFSMLGAVRAAPIEYGDYAEYWRLHSVCVATFTGYEKSKSDHRAPKAVFEPIGTLAGTLDPGKLSRIGSTFGNAELDGDVEMPREHTTVAAIFITYGDTTELASNLTMFMPEPYSPLVSVEERGGKQRLWRILPQIRSLRETILAREGAEPRSRSSESIESGYWSTHSLVYGSIHGTSESVGGQVDLKIDFEPFMKLSGPLDPSTNSRISVAGNIKYLKPPFKPFPGPGALLLLSQADRGWALASELSDFMPDDHSPICTVRDVSDPKLLSTLRAVQRLRKDDKPAEQKNELR